ncbi:MAG TPA: SUF system NifU family Fe-S cluster assembly protein [Kineosporiaceae bacterium]|nr:SUF system NifU family Fe-S cluster assembly protein [Kineosporiaceae bacterium]
MAGRHHSGLDQLYQQVILDHYREKHGRGVRGPAETPDRSTVTEGGVVWAKSHQVNPLCGDEVTVRVAVEIGSGTVRDVAWEAEGCSISQASTSVLHDLAVGEPAERAREVVDTFRAMVRSRGQVEPDEAVLGDGVAFAGVGRHANRVKCAMLGWAAFEDALTRAEAVATGGGGDDL